MTFPSSSITITAPNGINSVTVSPTFVELVGDMQEASAMRATFEYGWEWYKDDTDPTNPIQLNSMVELTRGSQSFKWFIADKPMVQGGINGEQVFEIYCVDKIAKLKKTNASIDGDPLFTKTTPAVKITEIALKQGAAIGDIAFPFFPTPQDTDPWIPKADTNATSTDVNIGIGTYAITGVNQGTKTFTVGDAVADEFTDGLTFTITGSDGELNDGTYTCNGDATGSTDIVVEEAISDGAISGQINQTTILAETSHKGFTPLGVLQIESEWIQYDGYDTDPLQSDKYRFKGCTRGALGTTAAAHTTGNGVIYQRISQKIHPIEPIFIEANKSGTWEPVSAASYTLQAEEGRFDFTYDILDFPSGSSVYSALRATYAVFDEDNASVVTLTNILEGVLQETVDNGGPGLSAGDMDVEVKITVFKQAGDAEVEINLTRVRIPKPTNTLDFIKGLLDEIGLNKSDDDDVIGMYYDHNNDKIIIDTIIQKATASADKVYSNSIIIDRDLSLEQIVSGVRVVYTAGQNENLVSVERCWHPAKGEAVGDDSENVKTVVYQDEEQPNLKGYEKSNPTLTGNNEKTDRLFDRLETTAWGLRFDTTSPGAKADCLYCWFNNGLDTFTVDEVEVIVDARRESKSGSLFHFQVLGVTDTSDNWTLDPTTVPEGNKVGLSARLDLRFAEGGTDAFNKVKLSAKDIGIEAEGIVCRWNGMAADVDGAFQALLKEITVRGHLTKTVLVQLTDDAKLDSEYIYAPLSYAKLVDSNFGMPRIGQLDIGQSTYNAAVSLGRLALLQGLAYKATRFYELQAFIRDEDIPTLGTTAVMEKGTSEAFTGVVIGYKFTYNKTGNGDETLELRLLDFTDTLI